MGWGHKSQVIGSRHLSCLRPYRLVKPDTMGNQGNHSVRIRRGVEAPATVTRHAHFQRRHFRGRGRLPGAGGFTLLETALAIIVVGTGVLAILAAQQAYHRQNDIAGRTGTALLLANELRELTLTLPLHDPITGTTTLGPEAGESGVADYDDLDDFAGVIDEDGFGQGVTFGPPINALRESIAGLDGWSQFIEVASVASTDISAQTTQPLGTTDLMRVRVAVRYQSPRADQPRTITQLTWVVGR